jgi:protein SCO1/2
MRAKNLLLLSPFLLLFSCNSDKLPVYGEKTAVAKTENGKETIDSVDYVLPDFAYVDQDSNTISTAAVQNKIFVTEFFFTSCPSICPKMQAQMLRVYEKYNNNPDVLILAFTIDPARDTVSKLKGYAKKLGIESTKWHLLTGNKDSIYNTADNFLVSAAEDADAPGGHVHSGNFILVDKQRRLRGYYDGTKEESVQKLLDEMDILLKEK